MTQSILLSSIKNEGPFLLEWIAYHRVIGFDRIVIAYNDCDDGSEQLLLALQAIGWVEAVPNTVTDKTAPQVAARGPLLSSAAPQDGDWCLWLDADEFLNIHVGERRLPDLLATLRETDGALLNWRVFGDGGGLFNGQMLAEPFVQAASPTRDINHVVKTLFRYGAHIDCFDIHRPILHASDTGPIRHYLAGNSAAIVPQERANKAWFDGAGSRATSRVSRSEFGWSMAQINHYAVRDRVLFDAKMRRGRGYKAARKGNQRHGDEYWAEFNLNDTEDRSILVWSAATRKAMDEALKDRAVATAVDLIAQKRATTVKMVGPAPASVVRPVLTFPEDVADAVSAQYTKATTILEYGSGGSAVLAAESGVADVFSVESDANWCANMQRWFQEHPPAGRIHMHWVDIGPTKAWGKPKSNSAFHSWPCYPISVWDRDDFVDPDVVLIDGRFRLACFLTTLMRTKCDVTILWDDYTDRPEYHVAERLLKPVSYVGRMAMFEVTPSPFPPEHLQMLAQSYLLPR